MGVGVTAAYASSAYSAYGYYGPINGKNYRNQAYVSAPSYIQGRTSAESLSGTVGGGWMGVLPRLYKGTALCKQTSDYIYNGSPAVGFDAPTSGDCGHGTYHSYGATAAWNGSGYNYVYTFTSPNLTW